MLCHCNYFFDAASNALYKLISFPVFEKAFGVAVVLSWVSSSNNGTPEDISKDFPKVRAATGLSSALPHVNASPKRKATIGDLDDASIAAICDLYQADFEAFGYPAKP